MAYFLETNAPPAQVSIHVLNMRGELVRTILDGDMQWAGQYGGRNGFHQIEWDGLTEDGKKARNGRYIIRIEAKDQTGTTSRNVPVVLIK
jgi:flagellar hook assembly protein FlgD